MRGATLASAVVVFAMATIVARGDDGANDDSSVLIQQSFLGPIGYGCINNFPECVKHTLETCGAPMCRATCSTGSCTNYLVFAKDQAQCNTFSNKAGCGDCKSPGTLGSDLQDYVNSAQKYLDEVGGFVNSAYLQDYFNNTGTVFATLCSSGVSPPLKKLK